MDKNSLKSYPKGYKTIAVFIDDYSRLAVAYSMKAKSNTGDCLELFVNVCYLKSNQDTEFTRGYEINVLKKLRAKIQHACLNIFLYNGTSDRFNHII